VWGPPVGAKKRSRKIDDNVAKANFQVAPSEDWDLRQMSR
jgi:hypothetical protein